MGEDKIKVLYVAGWGRSGSTVLGNILGQLEGFVHVGELLYVWERGLLGDWSCGCGAPFRECEVWGAVLKKAFGDTDRIDLPEMARLRVDSVRTRHLPLAFVPGGERVLKPRLDKYSGTLENLYRAIRSSTGCDVIVDSSKFPSYGYLLEQIPTIDLRVVHLVRDPRAAAYSWVRAQSRNYPARSSLLWMAWNVAAEAFWRPSPERYALLRYEDFVAKPRESVGRVLELVQEETSSLPFVDEREVRIEVCHTVSGNPNRFRTGPIELRPDEEWRTKMKKKDRALVTALTWPLLLRYGYLG